MIRKGDHRPPGPGLVLPAHAGMVPSGSGPAPAGQRAPRARGDGPRCRGGWSETGRCSPRTRGWSQPHRLEKRDTGVLPAHAGMVPEGRSHDPHDRRAPRARGDGPSPGSACPARARCSPRTRGWSLSVILAAVEGQVLPAHAGMVPPDCGWWRRRPRAPRARGDGPCGRHDRRQRATCSPRTRGWSPPSAAGSSSRGVLPAHAGMVLKSMSYRRWDGGAPRARGDGPGPRRGRVRRHPCSPRTRGWSPQVAAPVCGVSVLPAHAGMVPAATAAALSGHPAARC